MWECYIGHVSVCLFLPPFIIIFYIQKDIFILLLQGQVAQMFSWGATSLPSDIQDRDQMNYSMT